MKRSVDGNEVESTDIVGKYAYFVANDDERPIRAHKDELGQDNLLHRLATRRSLQSSPIPIACSRDVLRSVIATLRTGEVMLLGDTNMDEYFETMQASSIVANPYNKLFELDSSTLTQFLAVNGFSTTARADVNLQQTKRHLAKMRTLWNQLVYSIINWPVLRRSMRDCKLHNSPVSVHVTPSAARIHINTRISDQGRQYILRCLCERIATQRTTEALQSEQDLLEQFSNDDTINEFTKSILNTSCGPFWFILHDCSDRRKIRIDKIITRLVVRIMNEPTTDLEEPTKISIAIARIRKLWEDLCNAIPRVESYFGLCDDEPTKDILILREIMQQFGMKLVKFEYNRRTMNTSQLLTFPTGDVQLDSMDAVLVIHFFHDITQDQPDSLLDTERGLPERTDRTDRLDHANDPNRSDRAGRANGSNRSGLDG